MTALFWCGWLARSSAYASEDTETYCRRRGRRGGVVPGWCVFLGNGNSTLRLLIEIMREYAPPPPPPPPLSFSCSPPLLAVSLHWKRKRKKGKEKRHPPLLPLSTSSFSSNPQNAVQFLSIREKELKQNPMRLTHIHIHMHNNR